MKVFNFQDPTHKTDFGNSCGWTVFYLLKKPVGKQYLKIPRILIRPDILVPLEISAQFERYCLCSCEYFLRSIHEKGFSIYGLLTICNFPEKLAQTKYICVGSWNISSLLDISCPLDF